MRPNVDVPSSEQYECPAFGTRVNDADRRVCPECGSELRDLSNARDL